jgi:hypothetical protein
MLKGICHFDMDYVVQCTLHANLRAEGNDRHVQAYSDF